MNKPDRFLNETARRVMKTRLPGTHATAAAATEAMERSCGELYRVLETAMGPHGLQALVDRAVQISARDYPWLSTVRSGAAADRPLSGLDEAAAHLDVANVAEGYAALLASIIRLLITFIGEDLTLRFMRHAWPDVSFSKLSEGSND